MLALLAALGAAHAQDAVAIEVVRKGQLGQSQPALVVKANQEARQLNVSLSCGGKPISRGGPAAAGSSVTLPIELPAGSHRCKGSLSVELADGSAGEMPLSFEVEVLRPLGVAVARESIHLGDGRLAATLDRPARQVMVRAWNADGALLGEGTAPAQGVAAGQPIEVRFGTGADLARLEVIGTDADGFTSALDLFPWSYNIPHEDLIFASNSAQIDPAEAPKLQGALTEVNKVVARYGKLAPVKLYIAGYTDTVGDNAHNQALSEQRAASIARWFRAQGFSGPIAYQGFGERALALPTADGVDEARNRRALYVVAADEPAISAELPGASWKRL